MTGTGGDSAIGVWEPDPNIFGSKSYDAPTPFTAPSGTQSLDEAIEIARKMAKGFSVFPATDPYNLYDRLEGSEYEIISGPLSPALRPVDTTCFAGYLSKGQINLQTHVLDFPSLTLEAAIPSKEQVLGLIDEVCKSLQLGVRVAAGLVGVSIRRYHELRGTGNLPLPKLLAAAGVVDVLRRFYSTEPEVLSEFFARDEAQAVELLASGQYINFASRLGDLRVERARELEAVPAAVEEVEMPAGQDLEQMRKILHDPMFHRALDLLRHKAPATSIIDKAWRLTAGTDVEAAFEAIKTGEPLDEAFGFLATLDRSARDEFRRRAQEFLDDLSHVVEEWDALLTRESEAAFAEYHPYFAEPAPPDAGDDEIGPATEDEAYIFRYRLGIDLATGRLLREDR